MNKCVFRICTMLIATALLVVALASCSEESLMILCSIKLDVKETSRSFDTVVFDNTLSSCTLFYSTTYKGAGTSYYGVVTEKVYDSKEGIILSQGRWEITCEWKDSNNVTVATGTSGDIWVNLNTKSLLIYLDDGTGSASLTYEVKKAVDNGVTNAITDVKARLTLSKWDGSAFRNVSNTTTLKGNQGTEGNSLKIYSQFYDNLLTGKYLLVIETIDNSSAQTEENILFTDVIGFSVKPGQKTVINGYCEVINGVSGKNEYITWEDDPTTPQGNTSTAGNESSGSQTDLTVGPIIKDTIYVIQEDKNTSGVGTGSMDLSSDGKKETGPRIVTPPENAGFGINMNGNDVVLSTYNGAYDLTNSENTTIVNIKTNTAMTLFNYVKDQESTQPNTWGAIQESNFLRRYHANADIFGGTLNIIGPRDNSISNIPIVFQGPSCYDSNTYKSAGYNTFYKQGTINVNNPGAKIVVDGNATIKGHTGISSWDANEGPTTTIKNSTTTNIVLKNGACIEALGDYHTETPIVREVDYSDTAYGIKLVGNSSSTGSINITLDNGHISTSNADKNNVPKNKQSLLTNEACIHIENFSGNITINLTNNSSLTSESGTAIKLVNCTGAISINVDEGCTINAPTQLNKNGVISNLI